MDFFVGCAGWSIPRPHGEQFPAPGSHLARYAAVFNAVEINSSFYRSHQAKTYARWASTVPAGFRFAVKIPKSITHEARLVGIDEALGRFVDEVQGLGDKLGALLVQLPPSFSFAARAAAAFFTKLRARVPVPIVCEPRHVSWFDARAEAELARCGVSRVAADPAVVPSAARPGELADVAYFRLHGAPRMYYSAYDDAQLADLLGRVRALGDGVGAVWIIFDNTAAGAATANALAMRDRLRADSS